MRPPGFSLNPIFIPFQLTWADISMFDNLSALVDADSPGFQKRLPGYSKYQDVRVNLLKERPLLAGLVARVKEHPGIKKWLQTRPSDAEEPF